MGDSLKLELTDDLRAFVDENCGDGTLHTTPGDYIRAVLREKKEQVDAAQIRDAILEGYADAMHGRTVPYRRNLRRLLREIRD